MDHLLAYVLGIGTMAAIAGAARAMEHQARQEGMAIGQRLREARRREAPRQAARPQSGGRRPVEAAGYAPAHAFDGVWPEDRQLTALDVAVEAVRRGRATGRIR